MNSTESCVIVMPVYNEAACIEAVLQDWLPILDRHQARLLVIDDGSRDQTPNLLDQWAQRFPVIEVVHQVNRGHGAAVLRGYEIALNSNADFIFQTDSDAQLQAADFDLLWQKRDQAPLVLGIREHRADGWIRTMISAVMRWMLQIFFRANIRDANVPFRLMKKDFLRQSLASIDPGVFAPNIFLALMGSQKGLIEVPISHFARRAGQSSLFQWRLAKACWRTTCELGRFLLATHTHFSLSALDESNHEI